MDSQFNDLADFSRGAHDPFYKENNRGPTYVSEFTIKQNSLFTNIVQYLKDSTTQMSSQPYID
jgi:hypothetical protein